MLRRLTRRLTNNFGLKILALVFAGLLWLIVVNVEDPDRTTMMTIPVTIENEAYLTEMGKTYEVLKNSEISFTVTGRRSIIESLSESDFTASANMENINEQMTMIPVTITPTRYANQIEITRRNSAAYLFVKVENLVTAKFDIEPELEGSPADDCYIEKTEVNPQRVTVTGPESVVNGIRSARVSVSVDGAEEDVMTNGDIILLDADGNAISQERLSLNRTKAAVDIVILMGKEVPLKVSTVGTIPKGYSLGDVTASVDAVHLTGPPEILDQMDDVEITGSQLDVSERTETYSVTLAISSYLPEDVALANGEPVTVKVTVEIIGQETREFNLPAENISVENLPEGLTLQFLEKSVPVQLRGYPSDLEKIDERVLHGTLDASGLTEGIHTVTVTVQGEIKATAKIRVSISEADG